MEVGDLVVLNKSINTELSKGDLCEVKSCTVSKQPFAYPVSISLQGKRTQVSCCMGLTSDFKETPGDMAPLFTALKDTACTKLELGDLVRLNQVTSFCRWRNFCRVVGIGYRAESSPFYCNVYLCTEGSGDIGSLSVRPNLYHIDPDFYASGPVIQKVIGPLIGAPSRRLPPKFNLRDGCVIEWLAGDDAGRLYSVLEVHLGLLDIGWQYRLKLREVNTSKEMWIKCTSDFRPIVSYLRPYLGDGRLFQIVEHPTSETVDENGIEFEAEVKRDQNPVLRINGKPPSQYFTCNDTEKEVQKDLRDRTITINGKKISPVFTIEHASNDPKKEEKKKMNKLNFDSIKKVFGPALTRGAKTATASVVANRITEVVTRRLETHLGWKTPTALTRVPVLRNVLSLAVVGATALGCHLVSSRDSRASAVAVAAEYALEGKIHDAVGPIMDYFLDAVEELFAIPEVQEIATEVNNTPKTAV